MLQGELSILFLDKITKKGSPPQRDDLEQFKKKYERNLRSQVPEWNCMYKKGKNSTGNLLWANLNVGKDTERNLESLELKKKFGVFLVEIRKECRCRTRAPYSSPFSTLLNWILWTGLCRAFRETVRYFG